MRAVSALALILSVVALALAGASLMARPEAPPSPPVSLPVPSPAVDDQRTAALEKRVEALSAEVVRLSSASAPAGAHPEADVTTGVAAITDDHIKEVIQAELQAQMQRMRAQWGGGGGGGPGGNPTDPAALKQQLGLDDAKADQVSKLLTDLRAARRDIYVQNKGGDNDANATLAQEERAKTEAKAADILSADEMTKFKALLDQQQQRRRGPGGVGGPGGGGNQPGGAATAPPPPPPRQGTGF